MTVLKRLIASPATLLSHFDRLSLHGPVRRLRNAFRRFGNDLDNTSDLNPLIFFVHVPKTAGSTVNSFLHEFRPAGHSHCEAFFYDKNKINSAANSCDWLSGHVDLSTAETILGQSTTRPIRYFACMRNPAAQVMSHYNWLIEIFHRGGSFYESCPPPIKEISETIRSAPKDAASITAILERFGGLFLNMQSRCILGHSFDWTTGTLRHRLDRYEAIVDSGDVSALVTHLLGRPIDEVRRENISPYHFDPAVFDTDEMKDFLRTRNARDETLYRALDLQPREGA